MAIRGSRVRRCGHGHRRTDVHCVRFTSAATRVRARRFSGSNHADLFCSNNTPATEIPHWGLFQTVAIVDYQHGGSLVRRGGDPGGLGLEVTCTPPR